MFLITKGVTVSRDALFVYRSEPEFIEPFMIRAIIYLLISIFLITIIRLVIGIVMKGLSAYLNPAGNGSSSERAQTAGGRKGGVLRKDSFSGIYIAEDSAIVKVINGETHYFASEDNFREYLRKSGVRA